VSARQSLCGAATAIALLVAPASVGGQRPSTMAGRAALYVPNAAAATSHPLASSAALAVLQRGGNAVDAAITAAAVLSVVEPQMTGIGGDAFAILWLGKDKKIVGMNASGRAGSLMTRDELLKRGRTRIRGAEAVTAPGALAGWAALLEQYGTISLAKALEPAIRIAEQGFLVTPRNAEDWLILEEAAKEGTLDSTTRATFLVDGSRAPRTGDWFRNPDYARTLRSVAKTGPSFLYGGALGKSIVAHVKAKGGFLTAADLAAEPEHPRAEWVRPISTAFRGYMVYELPPNTYGIATLQMLEILEGYDLAAMGHNSAAYLHHLIEAKRLAYADLRHNGEPNAVRVPPARLLSPTYIEGRRALIDPRRAADSIAAGQVPGSETIYLTVADSSGNMISFINSNYNEWGSRVVVPGTGFVLHDRGALFTLEADLPNTVAPGKRPIHTLVPAFVTRLTGGRTAAGAPVEEPWLSFGVMGGSMQAQAHAQVLINLIVFGMDIQQAIDAPRFRHEARGVALEPAVGDSVRAALTTMGHRIVDEKGVFFGGAQAIMKLKRGYVAGSDPRKDGLAVGF
jgi:gamma-glutamyltranspeptidase / glutathione hydrolase